MRFLLFALAAGSLASSGASQSPQANTRSGQNQTAPEFKTAASQIVEAINKPAEKDAGCVDRKDKRTSDLCAQWKAADAARSAANAAWYLGFAGALIGACTLFVAVKAALYARDAAKH